MKLVDTCSLRNKKVEKMLRDMDLQIEIFESFSKMKKETFFEIFMLNMELMIEAFRMMENNTVPGKTLLDFTGEEVKDACFRVGAAKNFSNDADYVIAVMQELR